jgi:phosphoglucosamine mutase
MTGKSVLIDGAFGAMYSCAPSAFERLGAEVTAVACAPDGGMINAGSGAASPHKAAHRSAAGRGGLAFCYDGDGDRLIAAENGILYDGDAVLYVLARYLKKNNRLNKNTVVATVMSNFGLELALNRAGITLIRTAVGDRNVFDAMREQNCNLGGEQSGHIVLTDYARTGDGLLASVMLCEVMEREGATLGELCGDYAPAPQVLLNVPCPNPAAAAGSVRLQQKISEISAALAGFGRVFVRASGTEYKVRILAEGADIAELKRITAELAALV